MKVLAFPLFFIALFLSVLVQAREYPIEDPIAPRLELATIADLKAYPVKSLPDGAIAHVFGFRTVSDMGGGRFRWQASSAMDDNGITLFAPAAGNGRWMRIYEGPLHLEWAGGGASASKAQNDSAFLAALSIGGTLELLAGDYAVGKTVTITRNCSRLVGAGRGITNIVNDQPTPTFNGINAVGLHDIELCDFSIAMHTIALDTTTVLSGYFFKCKRISVERVGFSGCQVRFDQCNQGWCLDCRHDGSSYSCFAVTDTNGFIFQGNFATRGLHGFQTEASYHVQISNNEIYDCWDAAIRVEDSQKVLVKDNIATLCARGILVYGPQSGFSFYTEDVLVSDNILDRCYKVATTMPYTSRATGMILETRAYTKRTTFANNYVFGEANDSVLLSDLSANTIVNSEFATTAQSQAILGGNYETLVRTGNRIYLSDPSASYAAASMFYVNFEDGLSLGSKRYLTVDIDWHSETSMDNATLGVRFYSGADKGGALLGSCDLYNSGFHFRCMPAFFTVPADIGPTAVKCIEFYLKKDIKNVSKIVFSQLRLGLEGRIGYVHDAFYGDTQDVALLVNRFVNITYPCPLLNYSPIAIPRLQGNSWNSVSELAPRPRDTDENKGGLAVARGAAPARTAVQQECNFQYSNYLR